MNSPVTGEFPTQRASNAEKVSIWWRHHLRRVPKDLKIYQTWAISKHFPHHWMKHYNIFICINVSVWVQGTYSRFPITHNRHTMKLNEMKCGVLQLICIKCKGGTRCRHRLDDQAGLDRSTAGLGELPMPYRGSPLTHWGQGKIAAISQTTFSNTYSWIKKYEFRLRFPWNLFLRIELTIFQHWFR